MNIETHVVKFHFNDDNTIKVIEKTTSEGTTLEITEEKFNNLFDSLEEKNGEAEALKDDAKILMNKYGLCAMFYFLSVDMPTLQQVEDNRIIIENFCKLNKITLEFTPEIKKSVIHYIEVEENYGKIPEEHLF